MTSSLPIAAWLLLSPLQANPLPDTPTVISHPELLEGAWRLDEDRVVVDLYPTLWRVRFELAVQRLEAAAKPGLMGSPVQNRSRPVLPPIRAFDPLLDGEPGPEPEPSAAGPVLLSAEDPGSHPELALPARDRFQGWSGAPWVDAVVIASSSERSVTRRSYRAAEPYPGVPTEWWTFELPATEEPMTGLTVLTHQLVSHFVHTDAGPGDQADRACVGSTDEAGPWTRTDALLVLEHGDSFVEPVAPAEMTVRVHGPPGTVTCLLDNAAYAETETLHLTRAAEMQPSVVHLRQWVPVAATEGFPAADPGHDLDGLPPVWALVDRLARFDRSAAAANYDDDPSWDAAYERGAAWMQLVEELRAVVESDSDGSSVRLAAHALWELATACTVSYTQVGDQRIHHEGSGCVPWLTSGVPNDVLPKEPAGPEPSLKIFAEGCIEQDNGSLSCGVSAFGGAHGWPVEEAFDRSRKRSTRRGALLAGTVFAGLFIAGLAWWRRRSRRA